MSCFSDVFLFFDHQVNRITFLCCFGNNFFLRFRYIFFSFFMLGASERHHLKRDTNSTHENTPNSVPKRTHQIQYTHFSSSHNDQVHCRWSIGIRSCYTNCKRPHLLSLRKCIRQRSEPLMGNSIFLYKANHLDELNKHAR